MRDVSLPSFFGTVNKALMNRDSGGKETPWQEVFDALLEDRGDLEPSMIYLACLYAKRTFG